MSLFDQVNSLQREWTDKFVQVDDSVAELKRFSGLTGQVKTVNMSGQALVEFNESEDIGWYDIHPNFLTVVEVEERVEEEVQAAEPPAATEAVSAPAEPPATAVDTSKLSPLELARMQDTGGDAPAAAVPAAREDVAEDAQAEAPAAAAAPAADTSKLSPLELARMQDAGGDAPAAAAPAAKEEVAEEAPAEAEEVAKEAPAETSSAPSVDIPDAEGPERTTAILAACRAQDGG